MLGTNSINFQQNSNISICATIYLVSVMGRRNLIPHQREVLFIVQNITAKSFKNEANFGFVRRFWVFDC